TLAPAAMADPFTLVNGGPSVTTTYQGTGIYSGSSATITWTLSGNTLTLFVTNTSSWPNTSLSGIAFNTTPNVTFSISSQSGGISGWGSSGSGVGGFEVKAGNPGSCSSAGTLCAGETGTIVLTLTSFSGNLTIDTSIVHLQSLIDGNSIKPTGTTTQVPEPASLFLMGTGLLGFGRLARKRFRKA
ncbi:MAG: PEP-CTERM sorting domain-containing protein, partial [Terriglobales bacterium]